MAWTLPPFDVLRSLFECCEPAVQVKVTPFGRSWIVEGGVVDWERESVQAVYNHLPTTPTVDLDP